MQQIICSGNMWLWFFSHSTCYSQNILKAQVMKKEVTHVVFLKADHHNGQVKGISD